MEKKTLGDDLAQIAMKMAREVAAQQDRDVIRLIYTDRPGQSIWNKFVYANPGPDYHNGMFLHPDVKKRLKAL